MNSIETIISHLKQHLQTLFPDATSHLTSIEYTLQVDAAKQEFGDISTNTALILAKPLASNPRAIAQKIIDTFSHPLVKKIEIAGPGFINIFLTPTAIQALAHDLFTQKDTFFKAATTTEKYNIEFVSANPTGPLHFGHGRGGMIGDVLGTVLKFLGYAVTKEHYINDAGVQMQKLGNSLQLRCMEALGQTIEFPEDGYRGDYMKELANQAIAQHGKTIIDQPQAFFIDYAYKHLLAHQQDTLQSYRIIFDVWFSERTLYPDKVKAAIKRLQSANMLYEKEGALWFKSTEFGDDKDRVLKKSDGSYTYAAADAAYMMDKASRGFNHLIFILGQDHDSYPKRLSGLRQALGLSNIKLDCIIYQLVSIKEGNQTVKLSKRAGRIVELADIVDAVGADIARFFYLNRKADAHLDFNVDLALSETNENPVHYLHYGYVRTKSILGKAALNPDLTNITAIDAQHLTAEEFLLIKKLVQLKELLNGIKTTYQVHLLCYYLLELAELFHNYYHHHRVIEPTSIEQSRGRLFVTQLVNEMFERCFKLMGLSQPEKM